MKTTVQRAASANTKKSPGFFMQRERSRPLFFQPQLTVGPTDDVYEREADAVADQVMRSDGHGAVQTKISPVAIQPKCAACEEEEQLQRKESEKQNASTETPALVSEALGRGGSRMEVGTQRFMENRFGYNFGNVKIHNDSVAAKSAASIHALAYTSGDNIVFNHGQYAPGTLQGKRLLAHELTHVVQQGHGAPAKVQRQQSTNSKSCPVTVATAIYSRGNDDWAECSYETARITVSLVLDQCGCNGGSDMPLSVNYSAVLQGKSFTGAMIPNPRGGAPIRQQEGQASHIATGTITPGRSTAGPRQPGMALAEVGVPTNTSGPLRLSVDDARTGGIPGDPGDTVSQQLSVGSVPCGGSSRGGSVTLGPNGFQVINYSIDADSFGVQAADISLTEPGRMQGRIPTPLINVSVGNPGMPYPAFPGTPRPGGASSCACDSTTGRQTGAGCNTGTGGAGFGGTKVP
jgi:hypothetical protein